MMLIDRNVRIIEEGIDVAVRIGPLADSGFKAVRIGRVRQMLVASPAYLARRGAPATVADLAVHDLIGTMGPRWTNEWQFARGRWRLGASPRLVINTVDGVLAADKAAVQGREFYDDGYFQAFAEAGAGPILERRINEAAAAIAAFIAGAWEQAGKPAVPLELPRTPRRIPRS